jgi:transcriptional regulator with XRE-family HTH domain
MSDSTNVVMHLRKLFGTQLRLAAAAGVKQNTISGQKKGNRLTHGQMRNILRNAPEMGVQVTPEDFFPELKAEAQDAA